MSNVFILYHANCNDGSGAKYAAWKKFGSDANYFPVQYGKPMPDIPDAAEVYIIDFSYPRKELEALRARVAKLVILDHHKTAAEDLKDFPDATFDMKKSGAVLAWEYFHPGTEVPELLLRVQDRDLWNWSYSDTGAITSVTMLAKDNPEKWAELAAKPFTSLLAEGESILRYKESEAEWHASRATYKFFDRGNKVTFAFVNATSLQSEICNCLLKNPEECLDFAAAFTITYSGQVLVSLRSRKGGDAFDVSALAKKYGGGGHQSSAGCTMSLEQWLEFTGQKFSWKSWLVRYAESFKQTFKEFLPW